MDMQDLVKRFPDAQVVGGTIFLGNDVLGHHSTEGFVLTPMCRELLEPVSEVAAEDLPVVDVKATKPKRGSKAKEEIGDLNLEVGE